MQEPEALPSVQSDNWVEDPSKRNFLKASAVLISGALLGERGFHLEALASQEKTPILEAIEVVTLVDGELKVGGVDLQKKPDGLQDPYFDAVRPSIQAASDTAIAFIKEHNLPVDSIRVVIPGTVTNRDGKSLVTPTPPKTADETTPVYISAPGFGILFAGRERPQAVRPVISQNLDMARAIGLADTDGRVLLDAPIGTYILPTADRTLLAIDRFDGTLLAHGATNEQGTVTWSGDIVFDATNIAVINAQTPDAVKKMAGVKPPTKDTNGYWTMRKTKEGVKKPFVWRHGMSEDNSDVEAGFLTETSRYVYDPTGRNITWVIEMNIDRGIGKTPYRNVQWVQKALETNLAPWMQKYMLKDDFFAGKTIRFQLVSGIVNFGKGHNGNKDFVIGSQGTPDGQLVSAYSSEQNGRDIVVRIYANTDLRGATHDPSYVVTGRIYEAIVIVASRLYGEPPITVLNSNDPTFIEKMRAFNPDYQKTKVVTELVTVTTDLP